jgi:hypothetical protein
MRYARLRILWLVTLLLGGLALRLHHAQRLPAAPSPPPTCRRFIQLGGTHGPVRCLAAAPAEPAREPLSTHRAGVALLYDCAGAVDPDRLLPGDRLVRDEAGCRVARMTPARLRALGLPVAVNRATALEWQILPGVGAALADRIVHLRRRRGGLCRPAELRAVRGIGPRLLGRVRARLVFGSRPGRCPPAPPAR